MVYHELEQGDTLSEVRVGVAPLAYTDILLRSIWAIFKIRQTPVYTNLVKGYPRFFSPRHWFSVMGMAQCRRLAGKPSYYGYSIIDPIHPEMRSMTWNCYRSNAQRATLLS